MILILPPTEWLKGTHEKEDAQTYTLYIYILDFLDLPLYILLTLAEEGRLQKEGIEERGKNGKKKK